MLELQIPFAAEAPRILCIGAHPDDIEIGCGASMLALLERHENTEVRWVVLSGNEDRKREADKSAKEFLKNAGDGAAEIRSFKDGYFSSVIAEIKDYFESDLKKFDPTIIFTHRRDDLHQDHRVVSELTWNTFRNHLIMEYEIVKYDGDLGQPNVFFPASVSHGEKKVSTIVECFESQSEKHWFSEDAFWSIMRIRGVESASPTKYAEAFYGRKIVLG